MTRRKKMSLTVYLFLGIIAVASALYASTIKSWVKKVPGGEKLVSSVGDEAQS